MKTNQFFRRTSATAVLILVVALFRLNVGIAQTLDNTPATVSAIDIPIEEIVVIGQKSATRLRIDIRRLDREISDELNALIDDSYFQLICGYPRFTGARTRQFRCRVGFEQIARQIAYREASALSALNELSIDTFEEPDQLLLNEESVALTEANAVLLNSFEDRGELPQTELESSREEYQDLIFELAANNPLLAEKLVRRYFLQQALQHKKRNWWSNFFGREVQTISIPTDTIRLTR